MIHKIILEIDVPPGLESAIHHMAHQAIVGLRAYADGEIAAANRAMALIRFAFADNLPQEAQSAWNTLRCETEHTSTAQAIVGGALSEIVRVMSAADGERRRMHGA